MTSETGLSSEEFGRIQTQMLDLKTAYYQLAEFRSRLESELATANERETKLKEDLSIANAIISRSKKAKEIFSLEQEVSITKLKLNVQEEEFRLQQSTLLAELSKVSKQNEELKAEKLKLEQSCQKTSENFKNEEYVGKLNALQNRVQEYEKLIETYGDMDKKVEEADVSEVGDLKKKFLHLEKENIEYKNAQEALQNDLDSCRSTCDRLRQQNEESVTKLTYLEQQVAQLNEKFRKKQESYQMLSDEKERQYTEYRKSLDNISAKKDAEIATLAEQLSIFRQHLDKASETRDLHTSSLNSLQSECNRFRNLYEQSVEQSEVLQIQLQESLSANDCLSSQLHQAREEVGSMQVEVEGAIETACKRKELLDDMNRHLEEVKDKHRQEMESQNKNFVEMLAESRNQLEDANAKIFSYENVASKLSCLETSLENKNEHIRKLGSELSDLKLQLEMAQVQHDEFMQKQRSDFEMASQKMTIKYEQDLKDLRSTAEKLMEENRHLLSTIETCKQDSKDKVEQICLIERKHGHITKDLKRQIHVEKKRGDKLQDRLQEVLNEISRNRSPGLEDVRISERHRDGRAVGDSSSVSSWTVVSGHHNKESDCRSNADDHNSESSLTMIENEDHELIGRIAQLQRQNYELTEKLQMLEESSSAMADDLVRKTAIIEQYVKDKPLQINGHSGHVSSPSELRLPVGLKKMIDFVKIDQASDDVREMNKRLQLMLEESLMKNMHLQRDLEIMSKQAVDLPACDK